MKQLIRDKEDNVLNGVIIQGSARSDGNTGLVTQHLARESGLALIDLNDWDIKPFTYDRPEHPDDFLPLIHEILRYDIWVMATPVYWYAMSSVMKVFFDRCTDLLKWHKDTGRMIRGKSMGLVSCSGDPDLESFFSLPLQRSADYLGMKYIGEVHTWVKDGTIPAEAQKRLDGFAVLLNEWGYARVTH